ncbi:MAG: shikimate dehydrogenase [Firmicutes bacterium]|nr:shikimate dehydrogenase [Bacillota bacterium]MCL5040833.1 shikimate dehydrogenase [Bacillota bacterium]
MGKFGFIIHPLDISDVSRKFKVAKYFPDSVLEGIIKYVPAIETSHITGARSQYGEAEGWFIGVTLTPKQMMNLPLPFVLKKIIQGARLAEKLGAKIVGLGAFTSVVGDAGITIAKNVNIAVTTGNSYTVATALEGTREAARMMGIDLRRAQVAVVGATGSIGSVSSKVLAREVKNLTIVGRDQRRLEALAQQILQENGLVVRVSTDLKATLRQADVILTVTSSMESIIEPEDLKSGAVVCDVSRPRDVSRRVVDERKDVLVIEGGVVEVPGDVDFHFNFGFPPKTSYACMAETMMLAMEGRYENFSLGRDMTVAQIDEINRLAKKHGFRVAGFRSFERAVTREEIEAVRRNAEKKLHLSLTPEVKTAGS